MSTQSRGKNDKTHRNIVGKCVGCQSTEFTIVIVGRSLTFHGIHVKIIQDIECEDCFGANEAGGEKVVLKEHHRIIWVTMAVTPGNTVMKYSPLVNHKDNFDLLWLLGINVLNDDRRLIRKSWEFALLPILILIFPTVLLHRVPCTNSALMPHMQNKPLVE